ncbi:unnamed protein product [Polarella glacialis]|uniref:Uncharacterized protein n=1 Tax=Polarella glacialis TaxID=89957 RepID=A0A813GUK4_POLGL|nr:unnamed protein product [Polarella glacialis]
MHINVSHTWSYEVDEDCQNLIQTVTEVLPSLGELHLQKSLSTFCDDVPTMVRQIGSEGFALVLSGNECSGIIRPRGQQQGGVGLHTEPSNVHWLNHQGQSILAIAIGANRIAAVHEQVISNDLQVEKELNDTLGRPRLVLAEQWGLARRSRHVRMNPDTETNEGPEGEVLPLPKMLRRDVGPSRTNQWISMETRELWPSGSN